MKNARFAVGRFSNLDWAYQSHDRMEVCPMQRGITAEQDREATDKKPAESIDEASTAEPELNQRARLVRVRIGKIGCAVYRCCRISGWLGGSCGMQKRPTGG